MTQLLSYSSRPAPRWSRMSLWSLSIALLHIPSYFFFGFIMERFNAAGREDTLYFLAALFLPAVAAALLGITSMIRSLSSAGTLRGWPVGVTGALIATWPVLFLFYVVTVRGIC